MIISFKQEVINILINLFIIWRNHAKFVNYYDEVMIYVRKSMLKRFQRVYKIVDI